MGIRRERSRGGRRDGADRRSSAPRGRDLATGIVLGAGFGLAALLLYLGTTGTTTTGATVTILFGSIFALDPLDRSPLVAALGAVALATLLVVYRPLLLVSVNPELAAARGHPGPARSALLYLLALALAVALCGGHDRRRSSPPRCLSGLPPPRSRSPAAPAARSSRRR